MDEKDDIIEKQIADAMIYTTDTTYVNSLSNLVETIDERETVLESRLTFLESNIRDLEDSIEKLDDIINTKATRQDLENQRKQIEDEFKGMLTKSMYIVFALVFIAILFGYFF